MNWTSSNLQGLGKVLPNKQFLDSPARENIKNVQLWPQLHCRNMPDSVAAARMFFGDERFGLNSTQSYRRRIKKTKTS
ncbi:MAG: hypothetical protein ACYDG2_26920 [Ruminiclostridium sp.]